MSHVRGRRMALLAAGAGVLVLVGAGIALRAQALERWYLWRLESGSFTERLRAARELGKMRSTRALPGLVVLLRECRGHGAEAREAYRTGNSVSEIMVGAFGDIGPPAVPFLAQALNASRGQREYWRRYAGYALGSIQSEEAVPPLTDLVEDEDPCVRVIAFHVLGAMGARAKSAVPALTRALESASPRRGAVHDAAADALEKIQKAGEPGGRDGDPAARRAADGARGQESSSGGK
jgi:HEAT repeat protein